MGNRDRPSRDVKKPKKKDLHAVKSITGSALAQPMPVPELVRKKRRTELEVEER